MASIPESDGVGELSGGGNNEWTFDIFTGFIWEGSALLVMCVLLILLDTISFTASLLHAKISQRRLKNGNFVRRSGSSESAIARNISIAGSDSTTAATANQIKCMPALQKALPFVQLSNFVHQSTSDEIGPRASSRTNVKDEIDAILHDPFSMAKSYPRYTDFATAFPELLFKDVSRVVESFLRVKKNYAESINSTNTFAEYAKLKREIQATENWLNQGEQNYASINSEYDDDAKASLTATRTARSSAFRWLLPFALKTANYLPARILKKLIVYGFFFFVTSYWGISPRMCFSRSFLYPLTSRGFVKFILPFKASSALPEVVCWGTFTCYVISRMATNCILRTTRRIMSIE